MDFSICTLQLSPGEVKITTQDLQPVNGQRVGPSSLSLGSAPCQGWTWGSPEDTCLWMARWQQVRGSQVPGAEVREE